MKILYIEPFEGGSHAAFGAALRAAVPASWTCLTLPARHWKWRMRGAAVHFALEHRAALEAPHDLLVASSYLALAELVGLAPQLAALPRLLYFHENQLAFPVRDEHSGERDHHYGFTQLVSALAATRCVFNSAHNRDSFLAAGEALLRRMPDAVPGGPTGWIGRIAARSEVLGVPLALPELAAPPAERDEEPRGAGPLIVWNHRWEHDKGPARLFAALFELDRRGVPFRLALCGRRFRRQPEVFDLARERLAPRIEQWGPLPRPAYEALLRRAQLALSTAEHEFFGISMLEAAYFGARPCVPDRLAYPEHFPAEFRYPDDDALVDRLEGWCRGWSEGRLDLRADRRSLAAPYQLERIAPRYDALFRAVVAEGPGAKSPMAQS